MRKRALGLVNATARESWDVIPSSRIEDHSHSILDSGMPDFWEIGGILRKRFGFHIHTFVFMFQEPSTMYFMKCSVKNISFDTEAWIKKQLPFHQGRVSSCWTASQVLAYPQVSSHWGRLMVPMSC